MLRLGQTSTNLSNILVVFKPVSV